MAIDDTLKIVQETKNNDIIPNLSSYNHTEVLIAIIKLNRYDLLRNNKLDIIITDDEKTRRLIDLLINDYDIMFCLNVDGFAFSKEQLDKMRHMAWDSVIDGKVEMYSFLGGLFTNDEEVDTFVKENMELFDEYLDIIGESGYVTRELYSSQNFISLVFKKKRYDLIGSISEFSVNNLKSVIEMINEGYEIPYHQANSELLANLLENREQLDKKELIAFFKLFVNDNSYRGIYNNSKVKIEEVLETYKNYFIELYDGSVLPTFLAKERLFRDYCISQGKFNLAVQCILPEHILDDRWLSSVYAKELNLSVEDFIKRVNWINNYSRKNNSVYNLVVATMLKDENFNIGEHHFERIINDVSLETEITGLNEKEHAIVNKLFGMTDYKTYDTSFMIRNVIRNIKRYSKLVNSIDINTISEEEFVNLIKILQNFNNYYDFKSYEELKNYEGIRKAKYIDLANSNDINEIKQGMVHYLFNIDFNMAKILNKYFCYNRKGKVIGRLRDSELSEKDYNILNILNKIVDCNNLEEIKELYLSNPEISYDFSLPLETYLRKEYTDLYRKCTYVPNEKDGQKTVKEYKGKKVEMYMPTENFHFLIHCVGTCSTGLSSEDYRNEWEDFPQIQDHFVACSLINNIYLNMRSEDAIIFGFSDLEGSSLLGMGDTDIDSLGYTSIAYGSGLDLVTSNGRRAAYYIPSVLLDKAEGYNEIVIERRDNKGSLDSKFKRSPDYIISFIEDSKDNSNFMTFDELIKLEFAYLSKGELEIIKNAKRNKEIADVLLNHVDEITKEFEEKPTDEVVKNLIKKCIKRILQSKKYDESMKAASDFGIPLVVIDKSYYFRKLISESVIYTDEIKAKLIELYDKSSINARRVLWKQVVSQKSYEEITVKKERVSTLTITV